MGIFNRRVVNTGSIGNVQDAADADIDDDMDDVTTTTHSGVINTGVMGNVQNSSGHGNAQNINYRNR